MTNTSPEGTPSRVVKFRDARWSARSLVVGLVVLFLWRSVSFVDPAWLSQFPLWLLLIILGLAPQAFLLLYPIFTRSPNRRSSFGVPGLSRCLIEFGIASPLVVGAIIVLTAADYLVARISPGPSLTPDAVRRLAQSPHWLFGSVFLLFMCTVPPIAEEVFFRGFVYNVFRVKMPFLVAGLAQSLIFGFSHFFGVTHACVAFVLGLLLTAIYEWRRMLIAPILVHAGLNFAVAVGMVQMMAAHANRPVIGVVGDPRGTECMIRRIAPKSAAEEAGLQVGDIVTSFNSEPIRNFSHLVDELALYRPGDAIPVTVNRDGAELEATVVLRRRGSP